MGKITNIYWERHALSDGKDNVYQVRKAGFTRRKRPFLLSDKDALYIRGNIIFIQ